MSRIVIIIDEIGNNKASVLVESSKTFSISISTVSKRIVDHQPVADREIFGRDEDDFPQKLLRYFHKLDGLGCKWRAFELLGNEKWDRERKYFQITLDKLINMIKSRDSSLEYQRSISYLEGDGQ
jgi:hypothetical protein